MSPVLRAGSRGSALALKQAQIAIDALTRLDPSLVCEAKVIKTTGDALLGAPFTQMVGRGFFTKEIEEALLAGEIDFAVHSLKDLPTEMPAGLTLAAIPKREDPRDALVAAKGLTLARLPKGARVGTCSPRRRAQLLATRPDLQVVPLRGNLSTRINKVLAPRAEEGAGEKLDAAVVALAGIRRLRLESHVAEILEPEMMLPAVGQGFLALQARAGDAETLARLRPLDDAGARAASSAERTFLAAWGGGCSAPVGALAETDGAGLRLRGIVHDEKSGGIRRGEVRGAVTQAEQLGKQLAERLRT